MTKMYCDYCGKEVSDKFYYHHLDKETKEICLCCNNKVLSKGLNMRNTLVELSEKYKNKIKSI